MRWRDRLVKAMTEWQFNQVMYYYVHLMQRRKPRWLNLRRPRTFNEKTIWLKMHHRAPNAALLADKVRVKEYVAAVVGPQYVIPTIGVWEDAGAIDFAKLPDVFVLKANHGSSWNIICQCKSALDQPVTRDTLNEWLRTNYYDIGKEYQYRGIPPRIICETLLENSVEEPLDDYKIFCFSGRPFCVQVDLDRFTNHTRNFYDVDWNYMPFTTLYPLGTRRLPRPEALDEMLDVAKKLSAGLVFARIDLYYHRRRVYFGEVTLHHGGGFEPFIPREYDLTLGQQMKLPVQSGAA
jgi:teichuronopeptide biosynthesis TupA-like protein